MQRSAPPLRSGGSLKGQAAFQHAVQGMRTLTVLHFSVLGSVARSSDLESRSLNIVFQAMKLKLRFSETAAQEGGIPCYTTRET